MKRILTLALALGLFTAAFAETNNCCKPEAACCLPAQSCCAKVDSVTPPAPGQETGAVTTPLAQASRGGSTSAPAPAGEAEGCCEVGAACCEDGADCCSAG